MGLSRKRHLLRMLTVALASWHLSLVLSCFHSPQLPCIYRYHPALTIHRDMIDPPTLFESIYHPATAQAWSGNSSLHLITLVKTQQHRLQIFELIYQPLQAFLPCKAWYHSTMGAKSPLFWQYCHSAMHTMLSAVEFCFLLSTSLAFLLASGTASAISKAKEVSRHLKRTGLAISGLLKKPGLMNLRSLSRFLRIAAFEGSKAKLNPIVAAVQHHELCGVLWLAACFVTSALLWFSVCSASTAVMVLYEGFGRLVRQLRHNISAPSRYPHQPSDSRLLRFPPEIRFMIWQELLENRDTIYVTTYDGYLKLQACETVFLETFGQENTGNCGLTLDRTFFRTCRQVYNELDHFLYATKTFFIADPEVLVSFINGLNPVQRQCLGKLHLFVETEWTDFGDVEDFADYENWEDFEKLNERSQSSLTQSSLAIRWAIEALPSLRTVDLWIQDLEPAGNKYLAQGVFQILNNIQVSKSVTVTLLVDEPILGDSKALGWSLGYRKDFADAVWAYIRYPGCSTLQLTGLEEGGQAKYVLNFFGKKPGSRIGFGLR